MGDTYKVEGQQCGTFQEGYSAMSIASSREARRDLYPSKQPT